MNELHVNGGSKHRGFFRGTINGAFLFPSRNIDIIFSRCCDKCLVIDVMSPFSFRLEAKKVLDTFSGISALIIVICRLIFTSRFLLITQCKSLVLVVFDYYTRIYVLSLST